MPVYQSNIRNNGGGGGVSLPTGSPGDYLQLDGSGVPVFDPIAIASTGDYYVHFSTGVDAAGRGSVIAPFRTIQYAQASVPMGKRIKVLKDEYTMSGADTLSYVGTIDFEGATINASLQSPSSYLISNTNTKITGTSVINMSQGRFLNHTDPGISMDFEGVTVYAGAGFMNIPSSFLANKNTSFKDCAFFPFGGNASNYIGMFLNTNLNGASFSFERCIFGGVFMDFRNYSTNGFCTIKDSSFYGTFTFEDQDTYLKIGASNNSARQLLIQNTVFDMVSLGGGTTRAIQVMDSGTVFTMRGVVFARGGQAGYKSIASNVPCTIICYNVTSESPIEQYGAGVINLPIPDGFKFYENLPEGAR